MSAVTLALKLLGFGVYGASAGNEPDEPLGVVNVMAGRIHGTRRFVRRIKKRLGNRSYYTIKYGLAAAILHPVSSSRARGLTPLRPGHIDAGDGS